MAFYIALIALFHNINRFSLYYTVLFARKINKHTNLFLFLSSLPFVFFRLISQYFKLIIIISYSSSLVNFLYLFSF